MASSVIHMAVANEINKTLKRDNAKLLIGSIAPDISKHIGENKVRSHFKDNNDYDIPNIDKFLDKYKDKLSDDFVMGYFIHLYTDYLWYKYFMTEISGINWITKLDGTTIYCDEETLIKYMYSDYTDLNIKLIEEYDMNLKIFYEDIPKIENIIEEIPMDKLNLIIDATSVIIENSKSAKNYLFNVEQVKKFVKTCVDLTLSKLKELNML